MNATDIRDVVLSGLEASGLNKHKAAVEAGLPADAIRSIIDGHEPKASRLFDVCRALGMECYIGPRRSLEARGLDAVAEAADPSPSDSGRFGIVAYPVPRAEILGGASPSGCMLFTATFLREFGLDPTHLLAIEIRDDEMAPLLMTNGCAVADLKRREFENGGIFAFQSPARARPLLRRTVRSGDSWRLKRDIPAAGRGRAFKGETVLGQVVWASRMDFGPYPVVG